MNSLQATDKKHLIFEDQFEKQVDAARPLLHSRQQHGFCGKRYLCIHGIHDEKFWRFGIFDLLTNESKYVRFLKSSDQFQYVMTYFLDYKFMLVVEMTDQLDNVGLHRVTWVQLNWESGEFESVVYVERHAFHLRILVDQLNRSKFVLMSFVFGDPLFECQECELINGEIKLENMHELSDGYTQCSSGKLIRIYNLDRKVRIKTYSMVDKKEQTFETDTYPENVVLMDNFLRKWVVDRLCAPIHFQDSGNYGLMWTDAQTRHWNILDFSTIMRIREMHFFNNTLIVYAKQTGTENGIFKSSVKVYGISIGRPQSLRQKAWIRVIRNLKLEGHSDPYKEAARYLPLNTDLRPHWFEDVEEEALEKQDNEESNSTGTIGESEAIQEASLNQSENKDVENESPDEQGNNVEE